MTTHFLESLPQTYSMDMPGLAFYKLCQHHIIYYVLCMYIHMCDDLSWSYIIWNAKHCVWAGAEGKRLAMFARSAQAPKAPHGSHKKYTVYTLGRSMYICGTTLAELLSRLGPAHPIISTLRIHSFICTYSTIFMLHDADAFVILGVKYSTDFRHACTWGSVYVCVC